MNKEDLFDLAIIRFNAVDFHDVETKLQDISIGKKLITVLDNHKFIPTPCVEIKLDLHHILTKELIGYYALNVADDKNIIDDFLVLF